ncbi:hypothetical protein [Sinorhizobium alkalisoli]|uniref:hypothetical protein n=1 Tax=Sinorhizobium alkalisoli TaxID=1752398 RepID=UPI0012AA7C31|nr:hypothetical protein [Sinorhizobium alkalisoli]QFI69351.1 hypothetical protein EKH55_4477 [Sinorhizobium alkalisoli]
MGEGAFPSATPEDRANTAELQAARDRMVIIASELDKMRIALVGKGEETSKAEATRAGK